MPHTLLLADDSLTIQRVIELTFAGRDVAVVAVGSGDDAVRAIEAAPPDIVLADIDMPGPTGYDIARQIRNTPSLAHIPVLLLTGAFEPVDEVRAREAGSNGVLTKPFDTEEVIRRVGELLADGWTPSSSADAGTPEARPVAAVQAAAPVAARPPVEPAEAYPGPVLVEPPAASATSQPAPRPSLDDYFEHLDQAFAARLAASAPRSTPDPVAEAPEPEPARPILATAFSALLDAESTGSDEIELANWLAPSMAAQPAAVISDEVIDQIARRVVERLSDRVIRETVAGLVSATTERLVVQEIERIKRNIK